MNSNMRSNLEQCLSQCAGDSCRLTEDVPVGFGDRDQDFDPEVCFIAQTLTKTTGRVAVIRAVEDGRPADDESPAVSAKPSLDEGDRTITYHRQTP